MMMHACCSRHWGVLYLAVSRTGVNDLQRTIAQHKLWHALLTLPATLMNQQNMMQSEYHQQRHV
jgi:hypothetical protein